jgi:putative tryptophan/tyrosine transport system substrate-binding protein
MIVLALREAVLGRRGACPSFQTPKSRRIRAGRGPGDENKNAVSGVRSGDEIENAFSAIVKERAGALLVLADRLFLHHRTRIMDFAVQHRLPGVHAYRELVEAGGFMSYGPSYADMHRRAASYVDRILKGAKPADLPVQAPVKFEMVVNLMTARALGLEVPPALLARADEVIE